MTSVYSIYDEFAAFLDGTTGAGTVWIPKVPKGNRSEYEQSMSHALGQTNFTIMADQDTFHEDLSQHDLVESPEKSTYYPISGKQLDGVSQHRQALFASLPRKGPKLFLTFCHG